MQCPICRQQIPELTETNCCPLCGGKVGPGRARVQHLYIISGAIFASVLAYGALVAVLQSGGYEGPGAPPILTSLFLAATVGIWVALAFIERRLLAQQTAQAARAAAIVVAAMSESVATLGLVLYLFGEGIESFTIFLGLAAISFTYLALRMPAYARLIEEHSAERRPTGPGKDR